MKTRAMRTGLLGFIITLTCAFSCSSSPLFAQQQAAPSQPAFQIHFFGVVDYNSVNQLIQMIDQQVRMGTKDISILLSSPGGDPSAGLAAYTYLHGLNVNLTTFNLGDVDSAANLIFCAGKQRYSMPGTRFLIHGASYGPPVGTVLDSAGLDAQLAQIKNLNDMMETVIISATKNKKNEIDAAIHSQKILSPDEARDWGLVQEIRTNFFVPGANVGSISPYPPKGNDATPAPVFTSISGKGIQN